MPVLQFKGKTAVENYHHTVPHHRLEFDAKLSLLGKGEKPSLDGNLIIEGDNLRGVTASTSRSRSSRNGSAAPSARTRCATITND